MNAGTGLTVLTSGGRYNSRTPHGYNRFLALARVECGLPFLCHLLTQGEDYSLSNAFPTHALGI